MPVTVCASCSQPGRARPDDDAVEDVPSRSTAHPLFLVARWNSSLEPT